MVGYAFIVVINAEYSLGVLPTLIIAYSCLHSEQKKKKKGGTETWWRATSCYFFHRQKGEVSSHPSCKG